MTFHSLRHVVTLASVALLSSSASRAQAVDNARADPRSACVAIVLPSVQGVEGSATDVGRVVRDLLASYLTGPSLHAVALEARLPVQAIEEAKQKDCGNIVMTTLTRERGRGIGKALGQAAGTASWYVPYGGTAAGVLAHGVTVATAQAVASLASGTRAKDEMQLEYRVVGGNNAVRLAPATEKTKAKTDGEDLLTPLVERAAQAIATAVMK